MQASMGFEIIYNLRSLTGAIPSPSSPSVAFRMQNKKATEAAVKNFNLMMKKVGRENF